MILALLIQYLKDLDLGFGLYAEAPNDEEPKDYNEMYVVFEQTGSSTTNHIITTTIAAQSYGPTLYDAMAVSKILEAEMQRFAAEVPQVTRCELATDYNFTNTATKQYRWQAVYNITHYKFD